MKTTMDKPIKRMTIPTFSRNFEITPAIETVQYAGKVSNLSLKRKEG
jgi:hypothetical protein